MTALVKAMLHVCITVSDLDQAVNFYQDVLGFESVFQTDNDSADGALLGLQSPQVGLRARHLRLPGGDGLGQGTELNIVEFTDRNTDVRGHPRPVDDVGLSRLALLVDDVEQAFTKIRSSPGVEIVCPPTDVVIESAGQPAHHSTWFSFRDVFGVFVTITEAPTTLPGGTSD